MSTPLLTIDDTSLTVNNTSGHPLTVVDGAGITVNDASGNPRVEMGELPNGDYGLQVTDTTGTVQIIAPIYSVPGAQPAVVVAASSSWATFGFPISTYPITNTGRALITFGGRLTPDGGNLELVTSIDGVPTGVIASMTNGGSAMTQGIFGSLSASTEFSLLYKTESASGDSGTIQDAILTVWPL
jgi:hypothetical protein